MIIRRATSSAFVPPTKTAILLVAFHLAIRAENFMALVHRPFEIGGGNPVVMEIDAHPVFEIDAHLHGVVGVDAVANQAFFLANGRKRRGFASVIMINQIGPMRPDIAEWITLLRPLER